jgi:hypothetical protein
MTHKANRGRTPAWLFCLPIVAALAAIPLVPAIGALLGIPILSQCWTGVATGVLIIAGMGVFAMFQPFVPYSDGVPECPECGYDTRGLRTAICPECGTPIPRRADRARSEEANS